MFAYSWAEFAAQFSLLPLPLKLWLRWLALVCFLAPLCFVRQREARVVLFLQVGNVVFGSMLGMRLGLVRLLGLSHVLFWTPMVVYLFGRRALIPVRSVFGIWVRVFLITVMISLAFDYVDVLRYWAGERGRVGAERGFPSTVSSGHQRLESYKRVERTQD